MNRDEDIRGLFQGGKLLSDYCTFHIGGPAAHLIEVDTIELMQSVLRYCSGRKLRYLVLGKGSNLFFDDKGFDGVVIVNRIETCRWNNDGVFDVGAGYSFTRLGNLTVRSGFGGLEFASGIPGTIGGAVFMNAGAHGKEVADVVTEVQFVHADGSLEILPRSALPFAYRTSPFQTMQGAIVSARFLLKPDAEARQRQHDIISHRRRTQPWHEPSAGCFFRNPPSDSAGRLIEAAGLKGFSIGGAKVSETHANFIVNVGGASSADVLALWAHVAKTVQDTYGVTLEKEVRYYSYEGSS